MTLALLILLAAAVSGCAYWFFEEINWQEAVIGFSVSVLVGVGVYFIAINANQSESMINTGYVNSKFHRESYEYQEDYTYDCMCTTDSEGNERCQTCHGIHHYTEPERWYLSVNWSKPSAITSTSYDFRTKGDRLEPFQPKPKEDCFGYCEDGRSWSRNSSVKDYEVSQDKYDRTSPGAYASWLEWYSNPLKASQVLFFQPKGEYAYPEIYDYDKVDRSAGSQRQNERLGLLNAKLSKTGFGPSIQIRSTRDSMEYEKLVREWRNGRKNDLVIVISPDRTDILGWDNFRLKTDLSFGISQLADKNFDSVMTFLESFDFRSYSQKDFSEYSYLNIEVHWSVYLVVFVVNLICTGATYYFFTQNENGK